MDLIYYNSTLIKSFKTRKTLSRHIKIVHNSEKPYQCESCKMSFRDKWGLTQHRYKHTSKPLKSKKCEATFAKASQLKKSVKIHTGKSFSCQDCPYITSVKTNFNNHLQVHKCIKIHLHPTFGPGSSRSWPLMKSSLANRSHPEFLT